MLSYWPQASLPAFSSNSARQRWNDLPPWTSTPTRGGSDLLFSANSASPSFTERGNRASGR